MPLLGSKKRPEPTAEALRTMNEQLGDMEFEMEMAPYNNYTGGTPADKADYEGLYAGAPEYSLKGQYTHADATPAEIRDNPRTYRDGDNVRRKLYGKADTVQALTSNATPNVWQHEFSHRNNPERGEGSNRMADAITAPNKRAWDAAVDMEENRLNVKRRGKKFDEPEPYTRGTVEARLLRNVQGQYHHLAGPRHTAADIYQGEMDRGGKVPESMKTENWFMDYDKGDEMRDYSKMRQKQAYWPKALRELRAKDEAATE
jgi:hypothetical protein